MVPEGYRKLDTWGTTRERTIQWYGLFFILYFVFFIIFSAIVRTFHPEITVGFDLFEAFNTKAPTSLAIPLSIIVIFVGQLLFAVPHEAIHGLFASYFKAKPRYGVLLISKVLPAFYCTFDELLPRNQFLIVTFAPFTVLTILGIVIILLFSFIAPIVVILCSLNAAGSIGDFWLAKQALKYPSHVLVKDEMHGLVIFGRETDLSINAVAKNPNRNYLTLIIIVIAVLFYSFYLGFSFLQKIFFK